MAPRKKYDQVLFFAVIAILLIGIVMITSIGVPKSIRITAPDLAYPDCSNAAVDCYFILKNHVARVLIGLVGMFIAWRIPYKFWKKTSPIIFGLGLALLGFVLVGGDHNNTFASSWINIPGVPIINSLQPSEIAKFGLILFLSYYYAERTSMSKIEDFKEGFLKFCLLSGSAIILVMLQPDLGSTLVMASIAVVLYFLAGARWEHLAIGATVAVLVSFLVVSQVDYIGNRFNAFFGPGEECAEDYCWQSRQANIAIGSGGFWGKGVTQGIQKSYWLPQASDDFIFAASAEELGFLRTSMIVLLYALIAYRGFQIANHAPNKFAMLTAAGITTWISSQAFINIMVNTALFPITGITLPFMSYGGSSMVTTLIALGVLLNISKYTTHHAYSANRGRNGRSRYSQSSYRTRYYRT